MRFRMRHQARFALFAAIIGVAATADGAAAQDSLNPVIGATRTTSGGESFVFQCLMGAVTQTGAMLGYEDAGPRLTTPSTVGWYDLGGGEGSGASGPAVPMDVPCDYAYTTNATLAVNADGSYLGVATTGPVMPDVLTLHSPQSQTYTAAVADYFQSIGHQTNAVTLTQVIRTDLEGDGVEEVIITVQDDADDNPTTIDPGDHSAILLRRLVNGAVQTVVVDGEFYAERQDFAAPVTYEVIAVADVNGDGVMEIVATVDYYEGSSFATYEIVNGEPVLAMACGCGA